MENRVRVCRRRLGMSQKTLAELLGLSSRWVLELEAGRITRLRLDTAVELARALKQEFNTLIDKTIVLDSPADRGTNGTENGPGWRRDAPGFWFACRSHRSRGPALPAPRARIRVRHDQ